MKFIKRPIPIHGVQWHRHGDHPAVEHLPPDHPIDRRAIKPLEFGYLRTLENANGHVVSPGDWIMTGVRGEHWAIKPNIFAETYVALDEVPECAAFNAVVDRFAEEMKRKFRRKYEAGRRGWNDPACYDGMRVALIEHAARPLQHVDVANLAAMLWNLGDPRSPSPTNCNGDQSTS